MAPVINVSFARVKQQSFQDMLTRIERLMVTAGYVTSLGQVPEYLTKVPRHLRPTNLEAREVFDRLVKGWSDDAEDAWDNFAQALEPNRGRRPLRVTSKCITTFECTISFRLWLTVVCPSRSQHEGPVHYGACNPSPQGAGSL